MITICSKFDSHNPIYDLNQLFKFQFHFNVDNKMAHPIGLKQFRKEFRRFEVKDQMISKEH